MRRGAPRCYNNSAAARREEGRIGGGRSCLYGIYHDTEPCARIREQAELFVTTRRKGDELKNSRPIVLSLIFIIITNAASYCSPASAGDRPDYAAERSARTKELTQPYGWLSLTVLQWLKAGVTTVGSAANNSVVLFAGPAHLVTFELKDGKVTVIAAAPSLELHGRSLMPGGPLSVIGSGEDDNSALSCGPLRLWVIDRGGRRYLRVKDPKAATRRQFRGLRWYPPDEHFRVQARWIPDVPPHIMHVTNEIGQVTAVSVPGHVEFEFNGTKQTLVPMDAGKDGLWFVFRDATYLQTTYGGGRFLSTDAPSNGLDRAGTVILDFNRAVNPPCAYSPFATCPIAPKEDQLTIPIPAGEERYAE